MKYLLLLALFCLIGCEKDFPQKSTGQRHRVELYSGGKLVRSWVAVGTVGRTSGVYHFDDEETGKTVFVSDNQGTLVVSVAEGSVK